MSIDVSGIKQGQKAMWSMGDYPDIAKRIEDVAERLVEAVGAREGVELLDVATGSGNVAIAAARAGASVTGLDLTPELLEAARRRADADGVEVRWVEGDAEELPFADDSFDLVTSCFGAMFAPRHERAVAELVRVARPGATIGVTAWTPDGLNGRLFKVVGAHMPPPPPELKAPTMWGEEAHMRSLFADTGAELTFERAMATFQADSPASWVDYNERVLGPAIMARAALEPQGAYEPLREDMLALYSQANEAPDAFRAQAEYLLTLARLPE
jgi:ubiquinone/menaquinone biosynthesis C-methylase UbiE